MWLGFDARPAAGAHVCSALSFGDPRHIAVQRSIGEIRAIRPVIVRSPQGEAAVLAVDGLNDGRLAAFLRIAGRPLRLAVTATRARVLGVESNSAVMLPLPDTVSAADISAFTQGEAAAVPAAVPAPPAVSAALDLAKLARRLPAVLVAADTPAMIADGMPLVEVAVDAIDGFRTVLANSLAVAGEANVPLAVGAATRFVVFCDALGDETVAVVIKNIDPRKPVPVRLHSACLTGDLFGSCRCDCGDQLRLALTKIAEMGGGIVLYLDQEGRGIGLTNKLRAYRLQDAGLDTVDANHTLGFEDDERDYGIAARMLAMLGVERVRLLTNNPAKLTSLSEAGIEVVARVPLLAPVNASNRAYLTTKVTRSGHSIDGLIDIAAAKV
jgi:GTP cyclohydrolase II